MQISSSAIEIYKKQDIFNFKKGKGTCLKYSFYPFIQQFANLMLWPDFFFESCKSLIERIFRFMGFRITFTKQNSCKKFWQWKQLISINGIFWNGILTGFYFCVKQCSKELSDKNITWIFFIKFGNRRG